MKIKKLYPYGKRKALTLSYDDGIMMDKILVPMLNQYGIKCTFNLNSGIQTEENVFSCGETEVRRMNPDGLPELYKGHEVAMHMVHHPWPTQLSDEELRREVEDDRAAHEKLFGCPVNGLAYPFGDYDDRVMEILADCGVKYARTIVSTRNFELPERWLSWHATCHHNDEQFFDLTDKFLACEDELALFYLWGHSYEFTAFDNWDRIEAFCEKIHGKRDIWYATNLEICRYRAAQKALMISADETMFYNPSAIPVWVEKDQGNIIHIPAGELVRL